MKNLSDGKKCIILLALTLFMGFLLVFTYMNDEQNNHAGIIRLHVIANSDSPADQELKLKVRDAIISYMDYQYAKGSTLPIEAVRSYLNGHLPQIESVAEKVITENGFDYPTSASLDIRYIPERTYGDITFPAGNYEALCVTIGKGKGENWWCVLFPPLCLLDDGTKPLQENSDLSEDDSSSKLDNSDDIEANRLQLYWKVSQLLN